MPRFKAGDIVIHRLGETFRIVEKDGFEPQSTGGRSWQRLQHLEGALVGRNTWCWESNLELKKEYLFEESM